MDDITLRYKCSQWLWNNTIVNYVSDEEALNSLVKFVKSFSDEPKYKIGDMVNGIVIGAIPEDGMFVDGDNNICIGEKRD